MCSAQGPLWGHVWKTKTGAGLGSGNTNGAVYSVVVTGAVVSAWDKDETGKPPGRSELTALTREDENKTQTDSDSRAMAI